MSKPESYNDLELDEKKAIKQDFTQYLKDNVGVGFEIELARKGTTVPYFEEFGVHTNDDGTSVAPSQTCNICQDPNCWNHLPSKLIRNITWDGGGREFLFYATNLSSEEYASKIPLASLKKYFYPVISAGFHTHAMILHAKAPIPPIIPQNIWQLFRIYYVGYVWMFGNQPSSFIRGSYAYWNGIHYPPPSENTITTTGHQGIHFNQSFYGSGDYSDHLIHFDMEIRTADSTLDLGQLIAGRAISKALTVRSAELSTIGLLQIPKELLDPIYETYRHITGGYEISEGEKKFMKENALAMYADFYHLLSPFERKCMKGIIEDPVRDRTSTKLTTLEHLLPTRSPSAERLRHIILQKSIATQTQSKWIKSAARNLRMQKSVVRAGLNELNAKFIPEINRMVL
jgi:hypothetical protein